MVQKWLVDPPGGLEVVGRLSRIAGTGRQTPPEVRNWSGDPPGGSELVGRPSRTAGSGRETLLEVWK